MSTSFEKAFDQGLSDAIDPTNANLPAFAPRSTTIYSSWYMGTCSHCGDNFREGDTVMIDPETDKVYHNDIRYKLLCWEKKNANRKVKAQDASQSRKYEVLSAGQEELQQRFTLGLHSQWQPFGNQKIQTARIGVEGFGLKCPYCTQKIRDGDQFIKFPCPNDHCDIYLHQDLNRHLTCWDNWHSREGKSFCPNCGSRDKFQKSAL